ncbi:primosomal protein N' [Candidatus Oleimmundimicrobium sp.]|uniref:primosomal protein N' n=1 Tax=Candidatus Oleimmundimicrobium sp. TaxID=3060597 RepID=UPI00271F920C|nr:primosomal protein N' [Candidatus Oleimmundimicrobium sp.]MDO8885379.1 primosomal protein N' [Candidatus Oleimmundimicrobium sp.]
MEELLNGIDLKNFIYDCVEVKLSKKIAQIIIDIPVKNVDRPFEYSVPSNIEGNINIGSSVLVSFGSRLQLGYVVGFLEKPTVKYLNPILDLIEKEPIFDKNMINLCRWISEHYLSTLSESLKLIFPPGRLRRLQQVLILQDEVGKKLPTERQKEFVSFLEKMGGEVPLNKIRKRYPVGLSSLIGNLEKNGFLKKKYVISKPRINTKIERYAALNPSIDDPKNLIASLGTRAPKQKKLIALLLEEKSMPVHKLLSITGSSHQSLKSLTKKKIVVLSEKPTFRESDFFYPENFSLPIQLTNEQTKALKRVKEAINKEMYHVQLLQGVTGSGKTEIYLQAIVEVLNKDKTAIVLVPEIALTPQTVHRFRSRFGEAVAVLHSGLGLGERFDQWEKVKHGKCNIVVGARSALFAPLKNLGLIAIDEEHEISYKQNSNPRYHARDVAKKLAKLNNALLILGSATPSIESKHEAEQKNYELLRLTKRVKDIKFPQVEIVDMREESSKENFGIFSPTLLTEMEKCISSKKKMILFLNRRGYANFILCRDCGFVLKCKRCDVSLVYHFNDKTMRCHHCGYTVYFSKLCPNCKGHRIGYFGLGTQRVESEIKKIFPDVPLIRMDADTTTKRDSHRKKLIEFENLDVGILLGTQMIAKGLDFPDVTLVGAINADTALHLPDFRASERTFQLLMQLSGRAGRGGFPSKVIIQTYCPDSYAISAIEKYTYDEFFKEEIKTRDELSYPPFSQLINILFLGKDEKKVIEEAYSFSDTFTKTGEKKWLKSSLGPVPAPLSKIKNKYRWHMILKTTNSVEAANFLRENLKTLISKKYAKDVNILIDVDPIWTL